MRALHALAAEITAELQTGRLGRPLYAYDRVASTNDLAKSLADEGAAHGTTVLALEQTAGRGRLARSWVSPPGGMYLSVVLRPNPARGRGALVSLAVALGAAVGVEEVAKTEIGLKWPNDLQIERRKVGGILIEGVEEYAVAGIGINASVSASDLPEGAASLGVGLVPLVRSVLHEVEHALELLAENPPEVVARWRTRASMLGRHVRISGREELAGIAEDIAPDGALIIRTEQGSRRVIAGDVSISD